MDAMRYAFSGFDPGVKDHTAYYHRYGAHVCEPGEPRLFDLPHFRFWVYRCKCGKPMKVLNEIK